MKAVLNKHIFLTVLLFATVFTGWGQSNALNELSKIKQAYVSATGLFFTGTLSLFNKKNPGKVIEKLQAKYYMKGSEYYCQLGPVEILVNASYYISVDNDDRYMVVGKPEQFSSQKDAFINSLANLKKLVETKQCSINLQTGATESVITLNAAENTASFFKKYTICYSNNSGLIKKVVMETVEDENGKAVDKMLETVYSYLPTSNDLGNRWLWEGKFVTINGSSILLNNTYKNYQLVNQL